MNDGVNYDFGEWDIISVTIRTTHNYLMGVSNIIFSKDGLYYYIEEESDTLIRFMRMPDYIRDSYIRYNKVDLSISVIDAHINYHSVDNNHCSKLLSVKRDLKISKLKKNNPSD